MLRGSGWGMVGLLGWSEGLVYVWSSSGVSVRCEMPKMKLI